MAGLARYPIGYAEMEGNVSIADGWTDEPGTLRYTVTATDSGTATVGDEVGGWLTLAPSDGTVADNDEIYVFTANEVFLPGAGYDIEAEAVVKFTEANTDDANVFFGFASAPAADLIVNDGAGMRTSGTVIGFYKVDGGTTWKVITRHGSTTSVTDTQTTASAGGGVAQRLQISIKDGGSVGTSVVTFKIGGDQVKDSSGNPVIHYYPNASATEVAFGIGAKNGGANNEAIKVDKWFASQSY